MKKQPLQYLIVGSGGVGGSLGAFMTEAGKDVTLIARGSHLAAMREKGLTMETTRKGNYTVNPLKAMTMAEYEETGKRPDVIFLCVKGYSLEETIPFLQAVSASETVIIPLLNLYGTGAKLQKFFPKNIVTDGCVYIAAEIRKPGVIWQNGDIFRVVYGLREEENDTCPVLGQVAKDLEESDVSAILSQNIRRDALRKFAYVSPMAACGVYFDCTAKEAQKEGKVRETFVELMGEIGVLAQAMGICFDVDIVAVNLKILDALSPTASTSMQRDIARSHVSEINGLIYEVVTMGREYGVPLPVYEKIAAWCRRKGLK